MTTGAEQIHHERTRQITEKGYGAVNDDGYLDGQLILAAIAYAFESIPEESPVRVIGGDLIERRAGEVGEPPPWWPWGAEVFRPSEDPVRNLVVAGAFIAAEIDRLRRANRR